MYYFNVIDLFPYVLLFIILFLIINRKRKKNKLLHIAIIVFIFLAIRYGIGYDYFEYRNMILHPDSKQVEVLAQYLINFCSKLHFQYFFVITSLLSIYPIYIVSRKYSVDPILSFMVYILIPMLFLDGMSTIRNTIAYSMVLWSFMILLRERKKYLALLPFIIALGFHSSSIVAFAIFPLAFIQFKRKTALLIWIISFFFSQGFIGGVLMNFLNLPFLGKASWYLLNAAENNSGRTLWLAVNIINIINFYFWNKLYDKNRDNLKFLMVYNLGCVLYNLTINIDPTIALRLSNFCSIFLMLLLPYYAYVLPYNMRKNRRLIYAFLMVYFCSMFFVVIWGTPFGEKISFLPYQTIFNYVNYYNYQ